MHTTLDISDDVLFAAKEIARHDNETLGSLCITLASLWQSDRDGLQGVFLQSIARLLARKTTQQTARVRLTADRRELCRGSLGQVISELARQARILRHWSHWLITAYSHWPGATAWSAMH